MINLFDLLSFGYLGFRWRDRTLSGFIYNVFKDEPKSSGIVRDDRISFSR